MPSPTNPAAPLREPQFAPVSVVASTLGISRSKAYELLSTGVIGSALVGRARRVDLASLDAYVAQLRGEVA